MWDTIKNMSPQEFSTFVSNGMLVPLLFVILIFTIIKRDKKRDKEETARYLDFKDRENELRREKEEADERLVAELELSREASEAREQMLLRKSEEREELLKKESAKREAQLMKGFQEITGAMHDLATVVNDVRQDVIILQNSVKPVSSLNQEV